MSSMRKRAVYAPQIQKLFSEQENIGVRLSGVLADFFLSMNGPRSQSRAFLDSGFRPYLSRAR